MSSITPTAHDAGGVDRGETRQVILDRIEDREGYESHCENVPLRRLRFSRVLRPSRVMARRVSDRLRGRGSDRIDQGIPSVSPSHSMSRTISLSTLLALLAAVACAPAHTSASASASAIAPATVDVALRAYDQGPRGELTCFGCDSEAAPLPPELARAVESRIADLEARGGVCSQYGAVLERSYQIRRAHV